MLLLAGGVAFSGARPPRLPRPPFFSLGVLPEPAPPELEPPSEGVRGGPPEEGAELPVCWPPVDGVEERFVMLSSSMSKSAHTSSKVGRARRGRDADRGRCSGH